MELHYIKGNCKSNAALIATVQTVFNSFTFLFCVFSFAYITFVKKEARSSQTKILQVTIFVEIWVVA